MTITTQIMFGSIVLGICSAIHIIILVWSVTWIGDAAKRFAGHRGNVRRAALLGGGFASVIVAHTIQVWIWAVSVQILDALPDISQSIYFALVTYTTVGYGDVTLDSGFNVFGAMAAVTGLLNFGLSTAFLVGLLGKLLPERF